jgi:membrane-associated phospholipid phosphatase
MKYTLKAIRENILFYASSFLFLLTCIFFLTTNGKAENFISLNNYHSFWLNVFFVNYTFFGDGIFSLALCGILFHKKQHQLALCILLAFLSSGMFVQVLKNLIYAPRPTIFFEASQYLFKLDNIGNSGGGYNSFPSGHTTSAFSLATIFAVRCRKKYVGIILLLAAILVGYSRIYLAQHFTMDVFVGAIIGIGFATASLSLLKNEVKFHFSKTKKYRTRNIMEAFPKKMELNH